MKYANGLTLAALVSVLFIGAVQGAGAATDASVQPCHDDVQKFCADAKPGKGGVAKCLKEHEADLSQACKAHLQAMKDYVREAREACGNDVKKLCKDVKPGRGRVVACLKEHEGELSDACKAEMKR